ncbi:MAG: DedA family protein [Candidatus Micrarchaeota archaeon]|nr:DedA family protein [Candidatus Micrarchaeota archaeon]MDE1847235.1 DedA family protein [Candidatus Micrarchaeota archaeon]
MDFLALTAASGLISLITNASSVVNGLLTHYGYLAILLLMTMEYASLPVPSEIILPLIGFFAAKGDFSFIGALAVVTVAGIIGMAIDYFIAYYVGKDIVYRHAGRFHISKRSLDEFDAWFNRNGAFAVFVARLIPVARGLVSFPAGFAMMKKSTFFAYSIAGALIWDVILMLFGYYGLASNSISVVLSGVAVFAVAIYVIYHLARRELRKRR